MRESTLAEAIGAERPYLMRYARSRLHDVPLAEDVVQETLLAALQGADAFEGRAALRTWLTGILLRRIADHGRSRARRPEVDMPEPDHDDDEAGTAVESIDWIDPSRHLESRQRLDAVRRTFAEVAPKAAELIALREIHGMSHDDAAQSLGLSAAHAATLVHRARARVRELVH